MSNETLDFFHSASLRQRYVSELDDALRSKRLRPEEHAWLQGPARPLVQGGPDPVRVDRLSFGDDSASAFELSAGLMLSHAQGDDPQVYLYTLADGMEVFPDRRALLRALQDRFANGNSDALFESEEMDGDPFRAQMLAIVDYQVERVIELTTQMRLMPSLSSVLTASLARNLQEKLPQMPIDPKTHLLQIVGVSKGDIELTPLTQSLAQAAFDDYCHVMIEEGFERRFLCPQGRIAEAADAALFTQSLEAATAQANAEYSALLKACWQGNPGARCSLRELAIKSLGDSFRRELYRCDHEGVLTARDARCLQSVLANGPVDDTLRCSRLKIRIGYSNFYLLAATFAIQQVNGGGHPVLWFTPDHNLISFPHVAAMAEYFSTTQGREQLRPMLALEDQPLLIQQGDVQLDFEPIQATVMADRVDSILALQARNLDYAMSLTTAPDQMTAMIDDALDVRQLLDPRQLQFSAGRWRQWAPFNFENVWIGLQPSEWVAASAGDGGPDGSGSMGRDDNQHLILSASWRELAQDFESREQRLRKSDNILHAFAAQTLQQYVCVMVAGAVQADNIRVQWLESAPVNVTDAETAAVPISESEQLISMNLVSLLLECVSGRRTFAPALNVQVKLDASTAAGPILVELIPYMLDRAAADFGRRYAQYFQQARVGLQRQGDSHVWPDREALNLREDAIRLDLALGKRQAVFDSTVIDLVRQVVDRPLRSLRIGLGEPLTDAFALSLTFNQSPAAVLCDTLVLRQTLDPHAPVMLWCGVSGWGRFTSVAQLQTKLNCDLRGAGREHWLKLLSLRDRASLGAFLHDASAAQVQLRLDRIDGHAIDALQQQVLNRKQQDLQQLCLTASRCRFAAGLLTRLAAEAEVDGQLTEILDGLSMRIDGSIFEAMLPSWLTSASTEDLDQFNKIFKRFYLASNGGKDFLFDVPSLQDLARERLDARLRVDFPDLQFDPDQVPVTSHRYISAFPAAGDVPSAIAAATITHSESLTDYTINRFVGNRDSALSVDAAENQPLAQSLTPDYLRKLVEELDVGGRYKALLRQALSPDDTHYAERHRLFIEQLPLAMQAIALTAKVQGIMSSRAYEYISRVLEMPDGIAREAIDGVRVIISPLQLVADRGLSPDTVTGVYVIFPETPAHGPVLLYAIYHPAFVFREYSSREALTAAIRTDKSLQQLMLQRVEPQVYRRYAHGGFGEPHLASSVGLFDFDIPLRRPGPVVLGTVEEKGNALQLLFDGTVKVLLALDLDGSVSNEQVNRAGRSFLATLGLEQVLCLLPGKWATLVTLWQSHVLLRASAVSISGHRWGEALSEFSAALGVMVTARQQEVAERLPREEVSQEPASGSLPAIAEEGSSGSSWGSISLTSEQRVRLQELESRNMALNKLRHDPLLNLYLDDNSKKSYAAVEGKVFEVEQLPGGEWIIVGADGTAGPHVVIDSVQRWQLDLTPRLRGGGGIVTRFQASIAMSSVTEVMVIEASGMVEIRALYRDRARHIGQAHGQARRYLENCLDNLSLRQPDAALDPQVQTVICDFFGTTSPDAQLISRIENLVRSLFEEVMDASLSPYSSSRFVIGANRPGHEGATAFIIPADPRRRLFLTERFFRAPFYRLKPEAVAQGFDPLLHSQASVLIHELSHQRLDTKDIAYLEANAPYPDLLVQNTPSSLRRLAEVERLHDALLSHRTAESDLFRHFENGQWRDINRQDRAGYSAILQITGTKTLGEARKVFLADVHKRSQIMLHNADSVALLIVRLGRRNYVVPTP